MRSDVVVEVRESLPSVSLSVGELLETATASLHSEFHQLTREVQLDGGLDLLGAESLLLGEDHQVARLLHDLDEELSDDVVH